jgi:hypothetical protein
MRRIRIIGLALLALGVPAFAFGGEQPPAVGDLSVSASLGGCGLAGNAIVCEIDASWNELEGADYYTVSVTRADGSVVDLGQSTGSSRAIFVPYVGPGTYSVQVAAWGTPPGEEEPRVLAREKSLSTASDEEARTVGSSQGAARSAPDRDEAPGDETPAEDDPPVAEPPAIEPPAIEPPPACEEERPDAEEPEGPDEPAADAPAELESVATDTAADAEQDDPDDVPPCP